MDHILGIGVCQLILGDLNMDNCCFISWIGRYKEQKPTWVWERGWVASSKELSLAGIQYLSPALLFFNILLW